jgi:hypothetical protein
MAKDAERRGDIIEVENFYQHAEQCFRIMRGELLASCSTPQSNVDAIPQCASAKVSRSFSPAP